MKHTTARRVATLLRASESNHVKGNDDTLYLAPMRHGRLLVPSSSSLSSAQMLPSRDGTETTRSTTATTATNDSITPIGWIPLHDTQNSERDQNRERNFVHGNKRDAIILGRPDFLSSMFAACGCSKNVNSSRNKCKECRSILTWAGNLSRKTLRVTCVNGSNNPEAVIRVSSRGSLAAVIVMNNNGRDTDEDAKHLWHCRCLGRPCHSDCDDSDTSLVLTLTSTREEIETNDALLRYSRKWSKSKRVHRGATVSLRYTDKNLDFRVVSDRDIRNKTVQDVKQDMTNKGGTAKLHTLNEAGSYCSRSRISNVLKDLVDSHNRSNRRDAHAQQTDEQACSSLSQISLSQAAEIPRAALSAKRIWFCPRGQDMPRKKIDILTNRLLSSINGENADTKPSSLQATNVQIVDRCFDATHWIVSERVPDLASIAKAIPGANVTEETLKNFLDQNGVECLKPSWFDSLPLSTPLSKSSKFGDLPRPSAKDRWYGYVSKQRGCSHNKPSSKRQCVHQAQPLRNLGVSEFFLKLSKIYEQTPYLPSDGMKARQYHLIAGRLQKIGFDILPHTTDRELKQIPFVGVSTARMIHEILRTNRLQRLEHLRTDPIRIAMRDLMAIWGVGRATALSLIRRGYLNIHQVREGISTGRLSCFSRRQLIGVECYEDLLEDMSRTEVESIFAQILQEARKIIPDCEAQIMGSYRRGKTALGDLDVLIVSKHYTNQVPGRLLSELINALWMNGRIAYHLCHLPGLRYGPDVNNSQEGSTGTTKHSLRELCQLSTALSNNRPEYGQITGSATYMGIFSSPTVPQKHRRVDIKIWPYAEKPYASLYFTGGKYFNRSMRQWAKSKFNWKLDDKGLFDRTTGERVVVEGCTERDIFKKLQLVYKAPPDRKFFDDVHPLSQL